MVVPFNRKFLFKPDVMRDIRYHCGTWPMIIAMAGQCGFVLFAIGLAFVDVSVATILHETWPVFLLILLSVLFRGTGRYSPITWGTLVFMLLGLAGVALVILSHNESELPIISSYVANPGTLFGAFIVLLSSVAAAAKAFAVKTSVTLAEKHKTGEVVFASVLASICMITAGFTLCVIGAILSETFSWHQFYYAFLGGVVIDSIGTISFRVANLKTKDLGVNALSFATPLVSLAWLWALSILGVPHVDYLIIGALGIVTANQMINVKADKRTAYGALVVSLWGFGTFIYFHKGYETDVPLELPVTVFILVLSFRVDRLVRRTAQEEAWVFETFRRLESLAVKRQIGDVKWRNLLLEIDQHKTPDGLSDAYENLAKYLAAQMKTAGAARGASAARGAVDEIAGIRHLVDNLAHSRQQGSHFGEIVAIALTGALIVTGLLVFNGEREVYGEITSFVLPSVMVFLFFNIIDLQRDRRDKILKSGDRKHGGEYIVKFDDNAKDRKWQQWISVVTSAVIVLVFAWLFVRV